MSAAGVLDGRAPVWAVIAGGGTAGHVLPGLSIVGELVRRGVPAGEVHWVGSARGVETRLVPEAGFGLTALPGRGLQRRLALADAAAVFGLLQAFVRSWRLLGRFQPAVVVGLGGYASVACGVAAALRRVPLVVLEQNAVPGAANRLLSRFSSCSAVAFEGTDLPGARWVGNPVRPEVLAVRRMSAEDRVAARAALGVENGRSLVVVFGGSLGARTINDAVVQAVSAEDRWGWGGRGDLHVRHISGRGHHDAVSVAAPGSAHRLRDALHCTDDIAAYEVAAPGCEQRLRYDLIPYEDDMASLYAAADVVVSRAGATTVAELAAAGVPAVLVPLPGAPGDHQTANARALADVGAAVMVEDAEFDGVRLVSDVDALLGDPSRLESMARSGASISRPDAASAAADLVQSCASRPPPSSES